MFNICKKTELLEELKCKQCSKVLSVFPIYYCSAVGNICGRCIASLSWMVTNGTLERAVAYEAVAKYLFFPCCNREQGCEVKLKQADVLEHEKQCKPFVALCPFNIEFGESSMKCDWQGTTEKVPQHLQTCHEDFLQVNLSSFIMNVYNTHIKIFYTTIDNEMFLIVTQYLKESNKFYCTVMCCGKTAKNYCYRLEVGHYNDYFLSLRKPETEDYCNVQEFVNNQNKMIAVDVTSIYSMLNDPKDLIYCKISIEQKIKPEVAKMPVAASVKSQTPTVESKKLPVKKVTPARLSPPPKSKSMLDLSVMKLGESTSTSHNFLNELECPVCNYYMVPPIFICPTGHSLCSDCKGKVQVCPMCRFLMQDTRNFALENVANSFTYPCLYKNYGCTAKLSCREIKQHEVHCVFAYRRCPLKPFAACNSDAIVDIIGHLREKHSSYMVETNRQYSRDIVGKVTTSYWVTTFEKEVFIICCKHSSTSGPIKFAVLHVVMNEKNCKYKFELQFCDQTGKGLKLIISNLCKMFPLNPSTALKNCLMLPQDLLQPFITRGKVPKIFFKFYIQKL